MALFAVEGKGIVKEVKEVNGKKIVELPEDWACDNVRVYKLRKITFGLGKK